MIYWQQFWTAVVIRVWGGVHLDKKNFPPEGHSWRQRARRGSGRIFIFWAVVYSSHISHIYTQFTTKIYENKLFSISRSSITTSQFFQNCLNTGSVFRIQLPASLGDFCHIIRAILNKLSSFNENFPTFGIFSLKFSLCKKARMTFSFSLILILLLVISV